MNKYKSRIDQLLDKTLSLAESRVRGGDPLNISTIESIETLSRLNDKLESAPKYTLLYKRLDGVVNTYQVNSIAYMDRRVLKAVVQDKGWRSFRTDRIYSLVPTNE
jgi:hypothetical protein